MSRSAERNLKLLNRMSTTIGSTKPQLATFFSVSENTIKADLEVLEILGLVHCPFPDRKPQVWYATRKADDQNMSFEFAFVLNQVRDLVKSIVPAKLYMDVESIFDKAALEFEKKSNTNYQNRVQAYSRSLSGVDISKLAFKSVGQEVLEPIKAAMYSGNPLNIQCEKVNMVLSELSFIEFDHKLYLEGKPAGFQAKRIKVKVSDIIEAFEVQELSLGNSFRVAA